MTPFSVNTMTLTSCLPQAVPLSLVHAACAAAVTAPDPPADARPVVAQVASRAGGRVVREGAQVIQTNGCPRVFKKRLFDNQATVVFRCPGGSFLNMKVFANGRTQMTGARSEDSANACMAVLCDLLGLAAPDASATRVRLMNATASLGHQVQRETLYRIAREQMHLAVSFQPEVHSAVKISYFHNPLVSTGLCPGAQPCDGTDASGCCKKVTVLVFRTGSVIFTGGTTKEQIQAAHDLVASLSARI